MKLTAMALAYTVVTAALIWFVRRAHSRRAASAEILVGDVQLFQSYKRFLNEQVGMFSFTFALASLGTDSPQFYAFLSLGFVLLIWSTAGKRFRLAVQIWGERKHPFVSMWSVFTEFPVFFVGYASLFLVLFGVLGKATLKEVMHAFQL